MADLLYDLLVPPPAAGPGPSSPRTAADPAALEYLTALASRPLASLASAEPQALAQSSHGLLLSLQALSKKSHRQIIESASHHATLRASLPALAVSTAELRAAIPRLDTEAVRFSTAYSKASDSDVLARRKKALLLARNVERLVDVLELPTLLSSAISAAPVNHSSALDLNAHMRRLHSIYPDSPLVHSISAQADDAMRTMAANLILSLKAPGLKLAASLRTISWLRRVLPDLDAASPATNTTTTTTSSSPSSHSTTAKGHDSQERVLGALFLVCRLATLMTMLEALEPLRELADQEKARQAAASASASAAWSGGQQTERYLKRYVEIFREQSFAIVSMFRSIFPAPPTGASSAAAGDPLEPMPSALATFPLCLVDMLLETLRLYLPTVRDQAARDSLLTQVLYCAGSLGRLGGDFGLFLAALDVGPEAEEEWAEVVRRHRALAGRLESIAFHFVAGLGSGVLSAVLLQPIDLLKTRVQQSGAHSLSAAIADIRAAPRLLPALWRGAVPSALRTGFGSAIYFTSLNAIRQSAASLSPTATAAASGSSSSSLPKLSNTSNLVAGAAARSFAGLILMPLTVLKVRYESTLYAYTSLAAAGRDILAREGVRGFFAGYGATAVRDAPYAGLYVVFYEQSKKRLSALFPPPPPSAASATAAATTNNNNNNDNSNSAMALPHAAGINFASGVLSGVVCSVVSNPFDAVKTRLQLQPGRYRNMAQGARRMMAEEGARALWDGLALRMGRKAVSSALAWTVYEELIRRAERGWGGGGAAGRVRSSL
ncbi:mitochondrial carrier domain-containing protein [Staphylotrichum tortipilum]|uniref:Mitochondrial glycine transporter n=1 Tax=Staphylotrichum tortipilum TaxID=2831512 RepID=A0AAN6MM18_9PEZI|nr:mitochondrial carrier domain-containing protein [Staphylotrichum longicolle]